MRLRSRCLWLPVASMLCLTPATGLTAASYVFSPDIDTPDAAAPRGGSTQGAPVTLAPPNASQPFDDAELSPRERDARAIRALAGNFRATFEFIETASLAAGSDRDARPYRSWATERVFVIADTPTRIELQHIMVMRVVDEAGEISDPMVMKHWRQRWQWQPDHVWRYTGDRTWQKVALSDTEAKGRWKQSVHQVDDSPRYEALGRWHYDDGVASWRSERFARPLPRRERSVRNDYDRLTGRHQLVHTPRGWLHEQQARKIARGDDGPQAIAQEIGLVRYQRIVDTDFEPAAAYWRKTGVFWAGVRDYWDRTLADNERLTVRAAVDDTPLFATLFEAAGRRDAGDSPSLSDRIEALIAPYIEARDAVSRDSDRPGAATSRKK